MLPPQPGDSWEGEGGWLPWQLVYKMHTMQGWHSHPEKHKSQLPTFRKHSCPKWKYGQSEETTKILKCPFKFSLLNL